MKNEKRLLRALVLLFQRAEEGSIDCIQTALCIENSLTGFTTELSNQALKRPIADFELSVRARNVLGRKGVSTVGELTALSAKDLLQTKGSGQTTVKELSELLDSLGLRLRVDN